MTQTRKPRSKGAWVYSIRKDGRAQAYTHIGHTPEGKPIRQYLYGRDRKELDWKISQASQVTAAGFHGTTVGEFADFWLAEYVEPHVKATTRKQYSDLLGNHVRPALGTRLIPNVTQSDVVSLLNPLVRQGKTRTAQSLRSLLKLMFAVAVELRLRQDNPVTHVRVPASPTRRNTALSTEEAVRFLTHIDEDPLRALWIVALTTGLRIGELRALRWQDVDLGARTLTVTAQLQRWEGRHELVEVKTPSSNRRITLPVVAWEALAHHYEDAVPSGRGPSADWIFAKAGLPISDRTLQWQLKRHLKAAGLSEEVRMHDLRHTCATILVEAGVSMKAIQGQLGHSRYQTTADTYAHVTERMQDEAARAMDTAVGGR